MNGKNGIAALYDQWKQLKDEIKEKEKELKVLQETLTSRIPENDSKSGIYHNVIPGSSVAYAKVVKDLYDLIPKTKRHQIEQIKDKHTKTYYKHQFKPEAPV